jgi:hypothetical protein
MATIGSAKHDERQSACYRISHRATTAGGQRLRRKLKEQVEFSTINPKAMTESQCAPRQ